MTHQSQLENKKYRNWVKAGLGLKYTKEGLEPFCDDLVKQQHDTILNKVNQNPNLSSICCGQCDIKTLQPNHVRTKNGQCPLGQGNCNCRHPSGKIICPNNVCGAFYDEIIKLHESRAPNWTNTDVRLWCTEPWAVGKCFINAPGYQTKIMASEFDCSALLHVLLNNQDFCQNAISGPDLFEKVLRYRNDIVHSHTMELEDNDVTIYIDDMISVLEDGKALFNKKESNAAVHKLKELKSKNFLITTIDESEVRKDALKALNEKEKEFAQKLDDAMDKLALEADENKTKIKQDAIESGKEVKEDLFQTATKLKDDLETEARAKLAEETIERKRELEQTGKRVEKDVTELKRKTDKELDEKGVDVKKTITEEAIQRNYEIEQKGKQVEASVVRTGTNMKMQLENELDQNVADAKQKIIMFNQQLQGRDIEQENTRQWAQIRSVQTPDEYIQWKAGFQRKLVSVYMKRAITVSALPLQPEKYQINVGDMYVPPWMTVEIKNNENCGEASEIPISTHELFKTEERLVKIIFILGEAGSGKTTFCKSMIYYWCLAHSGHIPKTGESNIIEELSKYEFLFYVALRHYPDCNSIEMMLRKIHHDPHLTTLLQKESDKCLILLDGLDEWTPQSQPPSQFQTPGLPARDLFADYTIITTSRDWKFDTLRISDSEVDKKIKLKGINGQEIIDLSAKTVEKLNKIFNKNKVAEMFQIDIEESPVADVKHVPMILQQLVCLWFDDKLKGTSRCAVYSSMLDLYFDWKALKILVNQEVFSPPQSKSDLRLPEFLNDYIACVNNKYIIYHLSHLAFETMFDGQIDSCLTFTNSTFQDLNIPDNVIAYCLKAGILSEDQSACMFASRRQPSSFSFVHKSLHEYLAAVYVAIQFETMSHSSCEVPKSDIGKHTEDLYQFVSKYFKSCTSVTDILQQSNVFIILSGLKPLLLPHISEYINSIATSDNQMIQDRKLDHDPFGNPPFTRLQMSIQTCIESCIKEVLSRGIECQNSVSIADIVVLAIGGETTFLGGQKCRLNNVLSLSVVMQSLRQEHSIQRVFDLLNYLCQCNSLQSIKYYSLMNAHVGIPKIDEKIIELVKHSPRLQIVSLICDSQRPVHSLIENLSLLHHLTSLEINNMPLGTSISHLPCTSLCEFLEQSTQLQQIRLHGTYYMGDVHMIDLTKNRNLQLLDVRSISINETHFSSDNIVNCNLYTPKIDIFKRSCGSLHNACNLKILSLTGSYMIMKDITVTENLTRLLPSLISLNTLELGCFLITDTIITRPSDMKHLKLIKLKSVSMSLPTWQKFIDSLPALPQAVQVTAGKIIGYSSFEIVSSTARQYVREKTEIFRVTRDVDIYFEFVTKKA